MLHHMTTILVCYGGHFEFKMAAKIQKSSDLVKICFPSSLCSCELIIVIVFGIGNHIMILQIISYLVIILLLSFFLSSVKSLSDTFLGDAQIKLYETLQEYPPQCVAALVNFTNFCSNVSCHIHIQQNEISQNKSESVGQNGRHFKMAANIKIKKIKINSKMKRFKWKWIFTRSKTCCTI